jgi:hypothetical protein
MSIVVQCNDCRALLKFRDDALAKKGKCNKCGAVLNVVPSEKGRQNVEGDESEFFNNLSQAATAPSSQNEFQPVVRDFPATTRTVAEAPPAEEEFIVPQTRLGASVPVRVVVLVLLLIPLYFATRLSVPQRLFACVTPLILAGTFRTSSIRGDRFRTSFHIGFFPVSTQRCNFRGVSSINVKYGWDSPGLGTFLLFGSNQVVFGWLLDFLMPSVGGPYQIQLTTAKGRELMAWQGFAESRFRNTLDLLTRMTNAEVRPM